MHEYIEKCKPLDPNQIRETCIDFNTCTQFETGSVLFEGWITFNKVYGRSGAITTEVNGALPIFTKNGVLQVCKIAKDQQLNYFHVPRGRDLYHTTAYDDIILTVVEREDEYEVYQTLSIVDPDDGTQKCHSVSSDLFSKIDNEFGHLTISLIPYKQGPSLPPDPLQSTLDFVDKNTTRHPIYDLWSMQDALDALHVNEYRTGFKPYDDWWACHNQQILDGITVPHTQFPILPSDQYNNEHKMSVSPHQSMVDGNYQAEVNSDNTSWKSSPDYKKQKTYAVDIVMGRTVYSPTANRFPPLASPKFAAPCRCF